MNCILWTTETANIDISLYKNYKEALNNYFQNNFILIDDINQVENIKNLVIIDEHFESHKNKITDKKNIKKLNSAKTNVIIFNTEKVYSSHWKYNLKTQKKINKINTLTQILSDIDDIKIQGTPFKNKQLLSKNFHFKNPVKDKNNKVVFYGQTKGSAYESRRKVLDSIQEYIDIPVEIIESTRSIKYEEYLNLISKYKYVLNPLGAGKFINVRYYESLFLNSIPIQEIIPKMQNYYKELTSGISINFVNSKDLSDLDFNDISFKEFNYYLEDYFYENKLDSLFTK